ncbi:protein split ends isoform X4 [Rhizophagus clarus]|uniref:Protein split ends isoform X4 n=1 Tax=Rhizophagus clarus TaxID=94130 RepID=A0A8H3M0N2_9GLOM|nr:protein split ends isoform X4 [Rhizophagus clarus]
MLTQFPFIGVTEKDKATKAAKTTKTIRTYVANSSRDYNKERDERREEGSEHEQNNLHGQDVDIGEGNNRQDDDIERIILDMLPEQEERNIEKERRENEKKEMERRDKERREKERREKERREKERREKERRERDRREKDKEQEKNENDESESEEEIPVQFGAMTNQLQICNWLVLHPNVLHLANKMLDASTKQPSTNLPLTTSTSSPSDNDNYRLIDEEMKCFFLRTRNLPDHAFDKITQKIFGHDAYQSVAKSINERYHKSFSDYRYQLKNVLSTLVKEFRQIVESGYTESSDPTDEKVNNFISRKVVLKRILSRYVSAIDFTKLSETSLDKLIEFFKKSFKIVWVETESANIKEKVKELDIITEDLEIPSRSGRNIVSSLKLHLFS